VHSHSLAPLALKYPSPRHEWFDGNTKAIDSQNIHLIKGSINCSKRVSLNMAQEFPSYILHILGSSSDIFRTSLIPFSTSLAFLHIPGRGLLNLITHILLCPHTQHEHMALLYKWLMSGTGMHHAKENRTFSRASSGAIIGAVPNPTATSRR